jgi:hypothetical protein
MEEKMAALSKCCKVKLEPHFPKVEVFGNVIYPDYHWCKKCGLMYHKIQKKLKPDEQMDEWD